TTRRRRSIRIRAASAPPRSAPSCSARLPPRSSAPRRRRGRDFAPLPLWERGYSERLTIKKGVRGSLRHKFLAKRTPHPFLVVAALFMPSPARGEGKISEGRSHARCGIFGRSPRALPLIGGRGSLVAPGSMTKSWLNEYHGPVTSAAGARSFSWRT